MVVQDIEVPENDDARIKRSYTYALNPYQRKENCFYVALSRLLGIDSLTIATWTGNNEVETDNIGLSVQC